MNMVSIYQYTAVKYAAVELIEVIRTKKKDLAEFHYYVYAQIKFQTNAMLLLSLSKQPMNKKDE